MKVRLTKMVETATIRHSLQRVVELPCPPQVGWFLHGYTTNPALQLVVDKVGWNAANNLLECVLVEKKLDNIDGDTAYDYLSKNYGDQWEITRVYLTLDGLRQHMDSASFRRLAAIAAQAS